MQSKITKSTFYFSHFIIFFIKKTKDYMTKKQFNSKKKEKKKEKEGRKKKR